MSIRWFLSIFLISVFLIGVITTSKVDAVEGQRGIIKDHEKRITDLETNDADQDSQLADHETRINALEQKTTVSPLGVYDAVRFLGYLIDQFADSHVVMDPDSLGLYTVVFAYPPEISFKYIADLLFSSDDDCSEQDCCSGQAYGDYLYPRQSIFEDINSNHYIIDFSLQPIHVSEVNYKLDLATGSCDPVSSGQDEYRFPVKQIDFPLATEILQYPIVVKPIE